MKQEKIIDQKISKALEKVKSKNYEEAKLILKNCKEICDSDFRIYINLANIYIIENNINKSLLILNSYLKKYKYEINIANHLGKLCLKFNLQKEIQSLFYFAELHLKKIDKEKFYLYYLQGKYYERNNDSEKAIQTYILSINSDKNFQQSYIELLNLHEKTNNLNDLNNYINIALNKFKDEKNNHIFYFYKSLLLYRQKKYTNSYDLIIEKKLTENTNNKSLCIRVYDLISKNLEKLEDYKSSFNFIKKRNFLLKNLDENKKFNKNNILETIKNYKKFFNLNNFKQTNYRLKSKKNFSLVFLVGFPRSGTTLLDTILRTHSKISVLEEKPFLLNIRHDFFKKNSNNLYALMHITEKEKSELRNSYFKNFKKEIKQNKIIVDKLPLSLIELGFIKSIFPDSKIILSLRHPCDVTLSCFFSSFKINDAMINFLALSDTINFYNEVFTLFEIYEKQFNLDYYQIKYENIINNFNSEVKLLLKYLNLDFEKNLEKFYITAMSRNNISTPSYSQVINPLYKSSIGRWINYNNYYNFEGKLNKWINKFNY